MKREDVRCGEHFCPWCGDCLYCYGWDHCTLDDKGEHGWPDDEDALDEASRRAAEATEAAYDREREDVYREKSRRSSRPSRSDGTASRDVTSTVVLI